MLVQVSGGDSFTLQATVSATQCSNNTTNQCRSPATQVDIAPSKELGSSTILELITWYWYIDVLAETLTSLSFNVDSFFRNGWVDSYINSPYINRAVGAHETGTEVLLSSWAPSCFTWQAEDFYAGGRFYFAVWTDSEQSITVSISIDMQGMCMHGVHVYMCDA